MQRVHFHKCVDEARRPYDVIFPPRRAVTKSEAHVEISLCVGTENGEPRR